MLKIAPNLTVKISLNNVSTIIKKFTILVILKFRRALNL